MGRIENFFLCSFSKWISWLFLSISFFILLYTIYTSEIVFEGKEDRSIYYVVLITSIVFWSVVLKLSDEVRINTVTSVISLIAGLYAIEIIYYLIENDVDKNYKSDNRTKLEVISDMRKNGVYAFPVVEPTALISSKYLNYQINPELILPLSSVSNKISVYCNESGEYSIYKTDRYGFNNPDLEWEKEVDFLFIGDSFVHGACVHSDNSIPSVVRDITKKHTINLGTGGNGPLLELATLREYGKSLNPKRVIWVYYEGNDLLIKRLNGNLQNEILIPILMKYMQPNFSQNLIYKQKEIDNFLIDFIEKSTKVVNEYKIGSDVWNIIKLSNIRKLIFSKDNTYVFADPLFISILKTAKEQVSLSGGNFYFVYLPEFSRYSNLVDNELYRKKKKVMDLVKTLDIPVIDIHKEVFEKHNDPLSLFPFRKNGHYNAYGYNKVADAIVSSIKNYEKGVY
jgi:hypothetical protein